MQPRAGRAMLLFVSSTAPSPAIASRTLCLSLLTALVVLIIWVATGLGYFWPVWVWFGLAIALTVHVLARRAWQVRGDPVARYRVKVKGPEPPRCRR